MRTVRKEVYYCDHCNKRYLSKAAINKHEPACTANPARHCGICSNQQPVQTEPFAQYLEPAPQTSCFEGDISNGVRRVIEGQYDAFIAEVHDSVNGCPACMLAIIRQLRITKVPWEYADAKAEYWAEVNEDNAVKDMQAEYDAMVMDGLSRVLSTRRLA